MPTDRYRRLVEETSDWLWEVDRHGVYVYASPKIEELLGYRVDEVIGKTPFDLMPTEEAARIRSLFFEFVTNRAPFFALENCNRHRNGELVVLETSGVPIFDAQGEFAGYRGIDRDITARKRADEELRQAKDLAERVATSRSRLISAASHDLRQPLQSLRLYISTLGHQVDDPEARQTIDKMRLVVQSMRSLLDGLLDLSRLEADLIKPRMRRFDLVDRLQAAIHAAAPLAQEKGLDLRLRAPPISIETDPELLDRVVQNLVFNAVAQTETGGVLLGARSRAGGVRLEVWDTGPGIEAGERERIFEEFVQLNNPARNAQSGFGLGLAIVRLIAGLLNYRIEVHSRPGRGSLFAVHLPGTVAAPASGRPEPRTKTDRPRPRNGARILLIEDDAFVADSMSMVLQADGHRVFVAESGAAALDLLDRIGEAPDLVISDHRLPGAQTGAGALMAVRERLQRGVPGLIVTGDSPDQIMPPPGQPACLVMSKPVDADQLLQQVRALCGDRTPDAPGAPD